MANKKEVKGVAKKEATPKKETVKKSSAKATIHTELVRIQTHLKAPKNQKNEHGNFFYRSAEDICEGYKTIKGDTTLIQNDEIVLVGDRYYVKATATLCFNGESISSVAFAREAENQKGMNEAQLTGSTSSYARKYALNGLFAIDDTKDADVSPEKKAEMDQKESILADHETAISMIDDMDTLKEYWETHKDAGLGKAFAQMVTKRKAKLTADINLG